MPFDGCGLHQAKIDTKGAKRPCKHAMIWQCITVIAILGMQIKTAKDIISSLLTRLIVVVQALMRQKDVLQ
jgi:hypothetical protein